MKQNSRGVERRVRRSEAEEEAIPPEFRVIQIDPGGGRRPELPAGIAENAATPVEAIMLSVTMLWR